MDEKSKRTVVIVIVILFLAFLINSFRLDLTGSTILKTSSSIAEDIPLGSNVSDSQDYTFDQALADDDIEGLLDSTITFQGVEYDVEELLVINQAGNPLTVETSLTSLEDDYQTDVVMEVARDSIKYYYAFSESIQANKTSVSDPLEIKFLGKILKIIDVDDTTEGKFTAYVGSEYFMDSGDLAVVDGKTVKLVRVGSAGATVIDVDGVTETISSGSTRIINGIEIINDETYYDSNNQAASSATLIIGKNAQETYKDGDAYIEEDKDNPDWVWNVGNIKDSTISTTDSTSAEFSGPYFGIENDFIYNDDSDNPPKIGECIDLPNNYLRICLDSLTVADDNYATYTFEYENSADLSDAITALTSAKTIHIHTPQKESIEILRDSNAGINVNGSNTDPIYTNQIWLYTQADDPNAEYGNSTNIGLFYKDVAVDNKVKLAGTIPIQNPKANGFARISYDMTQGTDIQLYLANDVTGYKLTAVPYHATNLPDYNDNLSMIWGLVNDEFNSLGSRPSLEESIELQWTGTNDGTTKLIGAKDEDHRSRYGIIIRDPKAHGSSDEVVLDIPGDQVQANVVIKSLSRDTCADLGEEISPNEYNKGIECCSGLNRIYTSRYHFPCDTPGVCENECSIPPPTSDEDPWWQCTQCSNGICESEYGENKCNCPEDCIVCPALSPPLCLDGRLISSGTDENGCSLGSTCCGNNVCQGVETSENCPKDCQSGIIVTEEIKYNINLNKEWNLVSLPLILSDNSIEAVMVNVKNNINAIYSYDPSITEKWKVWRKSSETANTLLTIEPGKAYWIKIDNPAILSVNGTIDIKSGDAPGTIPTFNIYEGWNLIGYYGTKDEIALIALQNIDNKYSAIWTLYKGNTQALQGTLKGVNFEDELKLTHGYWIFLKEGGVIVPTT